MMRKVQYLYIPVSSLIEQGTEERKVPCSSFDHVGHMYFFFNDLSPCVEVCFIIQI